MKTRYRALLAIFGIVLVACDNQSESPFPKTDKALDETLSQGKSIWQSNCQVCHGPGLAGAPPAGNQEKWAGRIGKGIDTLIQHATEGYAGPGGHQMPARGGNPDLSDNEVAAAVKYMVHLSQP